MSTQAQHHFQPKTNERWQLSDKDTATAGTRRPRSKQQLPTNKFVDTKQQSVDDEASSKILKTDVKQVDKMTENKQRQTATAKQSRNSERSSQNQSKTQ